MMMHKILDAVTFNHWWECYYFKVTIIEISKDDKMGQEFCACRKGENFLWQYKVINKQSSNMGS